MANDLKNLQMLLYRLITAPNGVAKALAADCAADATALNDLIQGDADLSAVDRVEIYASAYFYRLLDCLKEDFPATLTVIGPDHFHNLVTGYLIVYPPTEPSVFYAGRYVADFLRDHPLRGRWPFLADLAKLERAIVESFHASDAPVLSETAMRIVPAEDWPALKLRTHPSVWILDCEWRVDELLREIDAGEGDADKIGRGGDSADDEGWRAPLRESVAVLVWRQSSRVNYRAIGIAERLALDVAASEASFAEICAAAAASQRDADDPVALITGLLTRWLADGLLILNRALAETDPVGGRPRDRRNS
jgi:hypothetical protein